MYTFTHVSNHNESGYDASGGRTGLHNSLSRIFIRSSFETYVNPLPTGLVLTSIVVGVSVTAVMLALTYRIYTG